MRTNEAWWQRQTSCMAQQCCHLPLDVITERHLRLWQLQHRAWWEVALVRCIVAAQRRRANVGQFAMVFDTSFLAIQHLLQFLPIWHHTQDCSNLDTRTHNSTGTVESTENRRTQAHFPLKRTSHLQCTRWHTSCSSVCWVNVMYFHQQIQAHFPLKRTSHLQCTRWHTSCSSVCWVNVMYFHQQIQAHFSLKRISHWWYHEEHQTKSAPEKVLHYKWTRINCETSPLYRWVHVRILKRVSLTGGQTLTMKHFIALA